MADLDKIKRRLGIRDNLQDQLIQDLIGDSQSMFLTITGEQDIHPNYDFMIEGVVYKLYNRKGDEATESTSVDGYTVKYAEGLFDEYMDILTRDFNLGDNGYREKGKVMYW